jgi:hypothetical protein
MLVMCGVFFSLGLLVASPLWISGLVREEGELVIFPPWLLGYPFSRCIDCVRARVQFSQWMFFVLFDSLLVPFCGLSFGD